VGPRYIRHTGLLLEALGRTVVGFTMLVEVPPRYVVLDRKSGFCSSTCWSRRSRLYKSLPGGDTAENRGH
jgi:hypothetical protein